MVDRSLWKRPACFPDFSILQKSKRSLRREILTNRFSIGQAFSQLVYLEGKSTKLR
ncbi:hypothetical protein HALDL1_00495 (plasmid) [Halobacterium sp. DL1]|nr:hypothetical protein HALDL1_00495 [Halobacterium sp. DL1]